MALPSGGVMDFSNLPGARRAAAANQPTPPTVPGEAPRAPEGTRVRVPSLVLSVDEARLEQVAQVSTVLPVILEVFQAGVPESEQLSPVLEQEIRNRGGRLLLGRIDVATSRDLIAALRVSAVPTVLALIGGRPMGLFSGAIAPQQLTEVFDELLAIAQQQGLNGIAVPEGEGDAAAEPAEPAEPPLPPLHQEAYDAIERRDYDAAIDAYKRALAEQPADAMAKAGLAQVSLLRRLQGKSMAAIRDAAAAAPRDVQAQLDVADLDVSGGHFFDAFDRLLTMFPTLDEPDKTTVRTRLLELFEVVGAEDPEVIKARRRLTSLLF